MVTARNALLALFFTACATAPATTPTTHAPGATTEPLAPWNAHAPAAAPRIILDQWSRADNRATCAPLTIADVGDRARGGTARRANFSGGWAVAWDVPGLPGRDASGYPCATCGRGAFGIAGAGVTVGPDYENAPSRHRLDYAGQNWVTYDLEGSTGPNWLAQIRVDDQQCVYQLWSFLGRDHLEHLIRNVRRAAPE